jgi:hypothetical protein
VQPLDFLQSRLSGQITDFVGKWDFLGKAPDNTPVQRAWVSGWLKGISPQNAKSD